MARFRSAALGGRSPEMALLIIGVAALGFNLRGPITSVPPVYPELQSQLGLSAATVSLLAATPVICFGVVSAFAAWLSRRLGEERVLLAAAAVLTCGLLLRGLWPGTMLFPGTVLASSAIAMMNVLLSSLSKRRWPGRAGLLIGIYLSRREPSGTPRSTSRVSIAETRRTAHDGLLYVTVMTTSIHCPPDSGKRHHDPVVPCSQR